MSTHDQTMPAGAWNVPVPPKSSMTEDEFVTWCFKDEVRAEWIDGEVIIMSPVSTEHARLVNWLLQVVSIFVEQRELGTVLGPELFVRFAPKKRRYLPDLFFVAAPRTDLFRKAHFEGAPDMIMEVVSPDSVARDWRDKYAAYESAGVREYWAIDPMSERAEAYVLSDAGKYERIAERDGWLASIAVVGPAAEDRMVLAGDASENARCPSRVGRLSGLTPVRRRVRQRSPGRPYPCIQADSWPGR
jgi:Uma2 family endonuclease